MKIKKQVRSDSLIKLDAMLWSSEYISEIESFFHNNFDTIYEWDFLPILFPNNETGLSKKAFLKNLEQLNFILDMSKLQRVL